MLKGISLVCFPSISYSSQTSTSSNPLSTSLLVQIRSVTPFNINAYFNVGRSSQPVLLARPVVAPNSNPSLRSLSPVSFSCSVGKGPLPTRVQYALKMPYTLLILLG